MTEVSKVTMYRSARHPEFIAEAIVPALELAGLDERCAGAVADLIDGSGCGVEYAVNALATVLVDYGTPSTGVPT